MSRTASVYLDEIVVQATREEPQHTDTSLVRIDRDELQGSLSRSVADALERDLGIFRYRSARGEQGVIMRGFDQRQVLVLLDGVPLYDAYDRALDLGKTPLGPVDHITLIKGGGSVAFGPNGLGGAINITTRRPGTGPPLEVEAASSPEDEAYRLRAGSDIRWGSLASHLDAGGVFEEGYHLSDRFEPARNEAGGRRDNSDTRNFHVSGKVAWDPSARHRFQAGGFFLKGRWGAPPHVFTANPRYWRWSLWEDLNLHAGHAGRYGPLSMEESVYLNRNITELDSFDDSSYSTQDSDKAFHSRYDDSILGVTLRPAYALPSLPFAGEATARAWVGARYDRHRQRPSGDAPKTSFSVYTVTIAPELELEPSKKWSLIAGLQADIEIPEQIEGFEPRTNSHVGPMVQAFCRPGKSLFLRFQANRRARFPTLKERYSSTLGGRLPNPYLEPEKAWNVGLDMGYERDGLRVIAGAFYSDVSDLIEETVPPRGGRQIANMGGVRYAGAEATVRWIPAKGLLVQARYAYLDWKRQEAEEDHLPNRPAHKGSLALSYTWRDRLTASMIFRAVSAQDFQDPDTGRWGRLGAYTLWDAYLEAHPLKGLTVWLNVENLLDQDYQAAYGFPDPGRTLWIGLRGSLG